MAGIKDTKIIKGQPHLLTYITPNEVEKLKALGGQETMTPEGIPAYPEYDNYGFSSQSDFNSGDVSRSNDPNVRGEGPDQNRVTASQLAATNAKEKQDAIAKDIAKRELEKSKYDVGPKKNIFEKLGAYRTNYNRNYKKKQLARYQKSKIDELNAKLSGLDNFDGYYGDTDETYADFIDNYAPSITEFGTPTKNNNFTGTGKYSKEFIDDVLSGKRAPPESFSKIDSKYPSMAVMAANFLGPKLGGPTTKEELMDIYSGNKTGNSYIGARDFDIEQSTGKKMMEIFEPNRYAREYGPQEGDGPQTYLPFDYNTGAGTTEDVAEDTTFDYRFGTGQGIGADVTRGYYSKGGKAEGGIMELRARRAFGGIMDRVTGRKAYGLGSIFKSVKKAASKVLKSPIGKAAIIGAGIYYGGGGNLFGLQRAGATGFGSTGFGAFAKGLGQKALLKGGTGPFTLGNLSLGKLGILGASALPFFMKQPKDPDIGMADRGGHLIDPITGLPAKPAEMRASLNNALDNADGDPIRIKQINDAYAFLGPDERLGTYSPYRTYGVKDGGRIGKAEGGLMDLGGMEKDYRAEGGFVPIGEYEKKDDVPARLSVNEFVFTADAVRGAGQGDIDKGAEIMENMMKNLEKGGTISEESQGNIGAQQMFETSERLGEVI